MQKELKEKADVVLALRELHGWEIGGVFEVRARSVFDALKSGGTFCVVQHRADQGAGEKSIINTGYLPEAWVIERMKTIGFRLDAKSEINANPKDTKDYPQGVWSLPPTFAGGEQDREKYEAIGESDRMTLRFVKP